MITRHDVSTYFSNAVVHGQTVYIAGQIADDHDADIRGQTTQILNRIDALLSATGSRKERLLSITVYLKDFTDYADFNAVYGAWIGEAKPARATVRADLLDPRLRIEIAAIAVKAEA